MGSGVYGKENVSSESVSNEDILLNVHARIREIGSLQFLLPTQHGMDDDGSVSHVFRRIDETKLQTSIFLYIVYDYYTHLFSRFEQLRNFSEV